MRPALRTAAAVALVAVAVGATWWGQPQLRAQVGARRAALPEVVMMKPPVWMAAPLLDELRREVRAALDPDPFHHVSLEVAVQRLAASPWIDRVDRIVRRPDAHVEVRATYRWPTALIEARDGYHLVDRHGVRLPFIYRREMADRLSLPIIRGVRAAPPRAGDAWEGEDVQAGLGLARLVQPRPWADQVEAIDVTNHGGRAFDDEPHLWLLTAIEEQDPRHNPGVRWGRAPGEEQFYEPTPAEKLQHLQDVLRRFGRIDAGGRVVDVFADHVLIRPARGPGSAAQEPPGGYTRLP